MSLDPKINVLRDSHSLHYKECQLGDNPEVVVACQSKNSLGYPAGVSGGGVKRRRGSVMHRCLCPTESALMTRVPQRVGSGRVALWHTWNLL